MSRFIENRHEVKLKRRIADIRPWTDKAAEALSDKFNLVLCTVPVLGIVMTMPILGFVLLPVALVLIFTHRSSRPVLPMRYPAFNPEPDPATGKPGNGIMFFGSQDSTSQYEKFKEIWGSDDDLRKHMLILGSTGSGKSETLKSLFFNALCWSSGFFIADGKADNKLPTDVFTMCRSVGIDDNLLTLNFLLAGKTPEQVRRSRRRRTNKLNPFTSADADTIIQMGANMLPKVEGEGKNWQEKALNLWRALVVALCYKRDTQGFDLSVSTLVEYMALPKIEELYVEGFKEAQELGEWSYGFISIKTYLDSGCPAYKVDKLLAKHGLDGSGPPSAPFGAGRGGKAGSNEQDQMAYEQHAYRTSQLMPVFNLLDKTYGHIFRDRFPEIDMVDVTLNNRIMTMLIPSLEKSAQEAENLGKLAIACLRVMMSRNLGGGVEGTRMELLESKATNAPYPYLVALDELGYYFSDGIAVIFAQARSLGFSMIPAAQDLEKLTEGSRAAEAGAMMANSVTKIFLRIDDAKKTYEFVQGVVQKAMVAVYKNFEITGMGWSRKTEVDLQEIDRVSMPELQAMEPGQGLINALGKTIRFRSYYMDGDLKKHRAEDFYVLRFLQVPTPTDAEVDAFSAAPDFVNDPMVKGERMRGVLAYEIEPETPRVARSDIIDAVAAAAASLPDHTPGHIRAVVLFEAAREALRARRARVAAEGASLGTDALGAGDAMSAANVPRGNAQADGADVGDDEQDWKSFDVADLLDEDPSSMRQTRPGAQPPTRTPPGGPAPSVRDSDVGDAGLPAGYDEDIDLQELLSPSPPFERKAIEHLRTADRQVESMALAGDHLIDPVENFLAGMRSFNMPKVITAPAQGQDYADVVAHMMAARGDEDLGLPAGASAFLAPSVPSASSPGGLSSDDEWVLDALETSLARPQAKGGKGQERTAVGFTQETVDQLADIEAMLGNPQPRKAVGHLEGIMSSQITPSLQPDIAADDDTVEQLLAELDNVGIDPLGGAD